MALVVVLILLAVPLYLWRRPQGDENAPLASASVAPPVASAPDAGADALFKDERLTLGEIQKVKCSASPASSGQEGALCDSLPFFEEALKKAVATTIDCAPKTGKPGSINYVLRLDFHQRKLHVYPGASGAWKGPQSRRAAKCVKQALPKPAWDTVQHQYRFYLIALMANYKPPSAISGPIFQ